MRDFDTTKILGRLDWLLEEPLLLVLALVFPILWWLAGVSPGELPALIDFDTLAVLSGLMTLSHGLQTSHLVANVALWLVDRIRTERAVAVTLVLLSAALSAVITNDVALFVVVPLTMGLEKFAAIRITRLVVFEALAVNAGSALSPIGNPQNLFLWQVSEVSAVEFVTAMLPLGGCLVMIVLFMTMVSFGSAPLEAAEEDTAAPSIERPLMWVSLVLYAPLLVLTDLGYGIATAVGITALFSVFFRDVLREVDWVLLLVFTLMFLDTGLLTRLSFTRDLVEQLMNLPGGIYTAGAILSQVVSNVPAALFLQSFTSDWVGLAWGVSVGGFGLATGSLANLIALRFVEGRRIWIEFHVFSLIALVLAFAAGLYHSPTV